MRQGASICSPSEMACQSPRAKRRNDLRSSPGMLKISASCSTISAEGRRSSDSNLRKALVEQLIFRANCSCVSPSALRRRLSHSPKETSANVCLRISQGIRYSFIQRHFLAFFIGSGKCFLSQRGAGGSYRLRVFNALGWCLLKVDQVV